MKHLLITTALLAASVAAHSADTDVAKLATQMKKEGYTSIEDALIWNKDYTESMIKEVEEGKISDAERTYTFSRNGLIMLKFHHKDGTDCYAVAPTFASSLKSISQIVGLGCK